MRDIDTTTGWAELTGTPKQIAYANDLRKKCIEEINRYLSMDPEPKKEISIAVNKLKKETSAKSWIGYKRFAVYWPTRNNGRALLLTQNNWIMAKHYPTLNSGWTPLTGSEKQVRWANDLRAQFIEDVSDLLIYDLDMSSNDFDLLDYDQHNFELTLYRIKEIVEYAKQCYSAKDWINLYAFDKYNYSNFHNKPSGLLEYFYNCSLKDAETLKSYSIQTYTLDPNRKSLYDGLDFRYDTEKEESA